MLFFSLYAPRSCQSSWWKFYQNHVFKRLNLYEIQLESSFLQPKNLHAVWKCKRAHQNQGSTLGMTEDRWGVLLAGLEASNTLQVSKTWEESKWFMYKRESCLFSLVVVGGRVVVFGLSFFFPFLSVLGFLVAFGSFGSLFFLSFFFFLPSSGTRLTLLQTPAGWNKFFQNLHHQKNH